MFPVTNHSSIAYLTEATLVDYQSFCFFSVLENSLVLVLKCTMIHFQVVAKFDLVHHVQKNTKDAVCFLLISEPLQGLSCYRFFVNST